MQAWSLVAMTPADIDDVLEIEKASFGTPWNRALFSDGLACKESCSYTVRHSDNNESRIIAYSCFRQFSEEMHILKIAVSPEWRNMGVSSWLLGKCIQVAVKKGATAAFLEVRPSNKMAVSFYSKFGFHIIGKRQNYYPENREDALLMMKKIKEAT